MQIPGQLSAQINNVWLRFSGLGSETLDFHGGKRQFVVTPYATDWQITQAFNTSSTLTYTVDNTDYYVNDYSFILNFDPSKPDQITGTAVYSEIQYLDLAGDLVKCSGDASTTITGTRL